MNIKRISLCKSESKNYKNLPNSLDSACEPYYNFEYPFSHRIHLDCERAVFLLKEKGIGSDICRHLNVVFVNTKECHEPDLSDHIPTGMSEFKNMRFVNVYTDKETFNKMTNAEKRRFILNKMCEAVILAASPEQKKQISLIIDEIYELADETECEFLGRKTKKYDISVKFRSSSLNGRYGALLYIKNNKTNKQTCNVLFTGGQFADLEYRIHQIVIKDGKCVIRPKYCEGFTDREMIVDINV